MFHTLDFYKYGQLNYWSLFVCRPKVPLQNRNLIYLTTKLILWLSFVSFMKCIAMALDLKTTNIRFLAYVSETATLSKSSAQSSSQHWKGLSSYKVLLQYGWPREVENRSRRCLLFSYLCYPKHSSWMEKLPPRIFKDLSF